MRRARLGGGLKHADTAAARVCDGAHRGSNLLRIGSGNSTVTWDVQRAICKADRAFSSVGEVVGGRRGTFSNRSPIAYCDRNGLSNPCGSGRLWGGKNSKERRATARKKSRGLQHPSVEIKSTDSTGKRLAGRRTRAVGEKSWRLSWGSEMGDLSQRALSDCLAD